MRFQFCECSKFPIITTKGNSHVHPRPRGPDQVLTNCLTFADLPLRQPRKWTIGVTRIKEVNTVKSLLSILPPSLPTPSPISLRTIPIILKLLVLLHPQFSNIYFSILSHPYTPQRNRNFLKSFDFTRLHKVYILYSFRSYVLYSS